MKNRLGFLISIAASGVLILGAYAVAGAANADDISTTCGGDEADIVAESGSKMASGTSGDDLVVLADGVRYSPNGGKDLVCNAEGQLEATIVTDDPGAGKPPNEPIELPNMVTLEEMENGELPGEWSGE